MSSSSLFAADSSNEDVLLHLFQSSLQRDEDNLFSSIDIRSLSKQISSAPVQILPPLEDAPASSLFGRFSDHANPPSSPVSSIMSLPDEVTQHTIPDEDDVWRNAELPSLHSKKVDTWETFGSARVGNEDIKTNPFATEQDPKVFDQLLKRHLDHIYSPNESGVVVDQFLYREVFR